jgi:hypothetical protein
LCNKEELATKKHSAHTGLSGCLLCVFFESFCNEPLPAAKRFVQLSMQQSPQRRCQDSSLVGCSCIPRIKYGGFSQMHQTEHCPLHS